MASLSPGSVGFLQKVDIIAAMGPNNPVFKLCMEGMKAETEGRAADALSLFLQAWEQRKDDFDAIQRALIRVG